MFRLSAVFAVVGAMGAVAAPVPREGLRPPVPLAGTVWEGDGVDGATVYEFHENGKMSTTYPAQHSKDIGTWTQNGNRVYWETCGKYCEFDGTLTGTTVTGRAWNRPGGNWTLTFKRKPAPAAN